jgi:hypothetical protein
LTTGELPPGQERLLHVLRLPGYRSAPPDVPGRPRLQRERERVRLAVGRRGVRETRRNKIDVREIGADGIKRFFLRYGAFTLATISSQSLEMAILKDSYFIEISSLAMFNLPVD